METSAEKSPRKRRSSRDESLRRNKSKKRKNDKGETATESNETTPRARDRDSTTVHNRHKRSPEPEPEATQEEMPSDQNLNTASDKKSFDECDSDEPYDTCFGVIIVQASISVYLDASSNAKQMRIEPSQRDMLRIFDSDSQIGAVCSPALCQFVASFKVCLRAFVVTPKSRSQKSANSISCHRDVVKLAVYGLDRQKRDVAYFLSSRNLFLQHPTALEYDFSVPYFNPQYLPGPSGSMPEIEGAPDVVEDLTESERAQVLRVFDTAADTSYDTAVVQSPRIKSTLKEHQLSALAMMAERESCSLSKAKFPTIWVLKCNYKGESRYHHIVTGQESKESEPLPMRGGVLADEMGLGKTLPVLALVARHIDHIGRIGSAADCLSTLVVAPKSAVVEWEQQVQRHVEPESISVLTYVGPNRERLSSNWTDKGIVLTTYDTLRSEHKTNGPLIQKVWARVILDEAHMIRNRLSQVFKAAMAIKSPMRWCLTGTPIQNRLDDYGALLAFIGVKPFLDQQSFKHYILRPIAKKHYAAFETLRKLVSATCLRRTKALVENTIRLPSKTEKTDVLQLDDETNTLYQYFVSQASAIAGGGRNEDAAETKSENGSGILAVIHILRLICNHGEDLLPAYALRRWRRKDIKPLDWYALSKGLRVCAVCGAEEGAISGLDISLQEVICGHTLCFQCEDQAYREGKSTSEKACPICATCTPSSPPTSDETSSKKPRSESVKIKALLRNLKGERDGSSLLDSKPSKSVVFSFWNKMLDLVEEPLVRNGFHFSRMDGQKTLSERKLALQVFQDEAQCTVMLATIGSAGEGINLTAANSVHILEPQWNPMVEEQAIDRVHRLNQTREVTVTRYFVKDSVETYVRWVQESKRQLIGHSLSQDHSNDRDVDEERRKKLFKILENK